MVKIKQTKRMLKCQFQNVNPPKNAYDGNGKLSHTSGKSENDHVENKSNVDRKTRIKVAGKFLVKIFTLFSI